MLTNNGWKTSELICESQKFAKDRQKDTHAKRLSYSKESRVRAANKFENLFADDWCIQTHV